MEIRNVSSSLNVGAAVVAVSRMYAENIETKNGIKVTANRRNGNVNVRMCLRASNSRGRGSRWSASGRRGPWACWHANRDFFRALFAIEPTAVVTTGIGRDGVTYTASNFESTFPGTAYRNCGSDWYPAYFGECCDC